MSLSALREERSDEERIDEVRIELRQPPTLARINSMLERLMGSVESLARPKRPQLLAKPACEEVWSL